MDYHLHQKLPARLLYHKGIILTEKASKILKELFDYSAVATFVLDPEHKVIYWNKSCETLTGLKASEVIDTINHWKPFYGDFRPCLADIVISGELDNLPKLYKKYRKSTLVPNGLHAEGWYDNLGGEKRYIIFDAAPIFNNEGELIAAMETLQDITDDKLMEQKKEAILVELQDIIAKTDGIRGFIPICASCKNIRQTDGSWITVEEYITNMTTARFSHGICPGCAVKLYPELFNK